MIPHILIIDTDFGAANTTRLLVAQIVANAAIIVEPTPERGRIRLQQHLADVLIIDPAPRYLAAAQLILWLKTHHPDMRVIVLASVSTSLLRHRMEALGVNLYQEKHQHPIVLSQQLQDVLGPIARADQTERSSSNAWL